MREMEMNISNKSKILIAVLVAVISVPSTLYYLDWKQAEDTRRAVLREKNNQAWLKAKKMKEDETSFEWLEPSEERPDGLIKARMGELKFEVSREHRVSTNELFTIDLSYYGPEVMSRKESTEKYGNALADIKTGEWLHPVYGARLFFEFRPHTFDSKKVDTYNIRLHLSVDPEKKDYRQSEKYPYLKEIFYKPLGEAKDYVYEYIDKKGSKQQLLLLCGYSDENPIFNCTSGFSLTPYVSVLWRFDRRHLAHFPQFYNGTIDLIESFIVTPDYQMDY